MRQNLITDWTIDSSDWKNMTFDCEDVSVREARGYDFVKIIYKDGAIRVPGRAMRGSSAKGFIGCWDHTQVSLRPSR